MKKLLLIALAAGAIAGLSSCNKGSSAVSTMTYNIQTFNLITSIDGEGTPSVAQSTYKFNFDLYQATATVGTDFNSISGPISFTTEPIKYTGGMYEWEGGLHEIIKISSFKENNIYNLDCQISSMAYFPAIIGGLPAITYPTNFKYLIMSYQVGSNTLVRTFWPDATFSGATTTTYPGANGTNKNFTSSDIKYRVVMNPVDKKATVVLYDAKFAEEMPNAITNIELKDLPVTFTNSGYEINGSNITPSIYENGVGTPNTRFVFDSFSLSVGGDLTTTTINYTVAGGFKGYFEGKCINQLPTTSGN